VEPAGSSAANRYANLNITYALAEERGQKPAQNARRKIETQVRNSLSDFLLRLKAKCRVEVFVTDLTPETIRLLSSLIDRQGSQADLKRAVDATYKQAGRQKTDVELLYYALQPFFDTPLSQSTPLLVLWTRLLGSEGFYRIVA